VTVGDIPASVAEAAEVARSALLEMVAEQDEALLEKFFAEGTLSSEELASGLKTAFRQRKIFPVFFTSATRVQAITPLLDALVDLVPSPAEVENAFLRDDGQEVTLSASLDQPALSYVFKTISDPYAGRISLMRVYLGSFNPDGTYQNKTRDVAERFGAVNWIQGKELIPTEKLVAGDIGAVAKLKETKTGDTLAAKESALKVPPVRIPEPTISFAITPKSKGDEDKIAGALAKIQDEDPSLQVSRDPQTKEQRITGEKGRHHKAGLAKDNDEEDAVHPAAVGLNERVQVHVQVQQEIEELQDVAHAVCPPGRSRLPLLASCGQVGTEARTPTARRLQSALPTTPLPPLLQLPPPRQQ
jgi:elongation factor G